MWEMTAKENEDNPFSLSRVLSKNFLIELILVSFAKKGFEKCTKHKGASLIKSQV